MKTADIVAVINKDLSGTLTPKQQSDLSNLINNEKNQANPDMKDINTLFVKYIKQEPDLNENYSEEVLISELQKAQKQGSSFWDKFSKTCDTVKSAFDKRMLKIQRKALLQQ